MATDEFLRPDQILNRIYNSGSVQVIFREDEILNSTFSEDDDALKISIGGGNVPIPSGSINADGVNYDSTDSSLQSDNVNDAIDELDHNVTTIINSGSVTTYIETMGGTKIATGNFKNTLTGDSDVSGSLYVYNDLKFDGNLIGIVDKIETVGGTSLRTGVGQSVHMGDLISVGNLISTISLSAPNIVTEAFSVGFIVSGSVDVSGSFSSHEITTGNIFGDSVEVNDVNTTTLYTNLIDFNTAISDLPYKEGRLFYSNESKAFIGYNEQSAVKQQLGQEVWFRVYNNSGVTIPNGKVVGPLGQFSGVPSIGLANAHIKEQSRLVGVTTMEIPNNSYGYVTKLGAVGGMDTSMFELGDLLYLSDITSGELTLSRPTDGSYSVIVGSVSNVGTTDGKIVVDIIVSDLTVEVTDTNGFPEDQRDKTTLSVNESNRTFTISSNDGQFHYYEIGEKYEQYGDDSVIFSDQEGEHWFYYEEGILLTEFDPSSTRQVHIILNHAFISSIYWNAGDKNVVIDIQDERHSIGMSPQTHLNLHLTRGAQWVSGYGLDNFDADGDGDDDSSAQFSVSTGVFFDEDISHTESGIPIGSTIPVIYNDGATGNIRQDSTTGFAVLSNPVGRLYYNEWTGTTWQLSEVPDRDASLYHIFSFNGQTVNTISVMGQNAYGSVNAARAGAATEISNLISQLPFAEMIPIASIVYETRNSYDNEVSARIRTVDGQNYVDWRVTELSQGSAPTSHSNLTNVNQAGTGILDGHISDQAQSIDGEKIFIQNLTIEKDLIVNGKRIIQNVDETLITDNIVVLNSGELGAGVTAGVTGVMFDRGTQTNYAYIYEESTQLFKIGEYQNLNGTVVSATSISIVLDTNASSTDDEYNGKVLKIYTDGGVPAQFRTITNYVGSTKTAIVSTWTTIPDANWRYEIQGIINNTQRITTGPNSIVDGGYFIGHSATNSHIYKSAAQTAIDLNYWKLNGSDLYFMNKVGIGTATPDVPLHVKSFIDTVLKVESTDDIVRIQLTDDLNSGYVMKSGNVIGIGYSTTLAGNSLFVTNGGDVGIGTSTPTNTLALQGSLDYQNSGSRRITSGYNASSGKGEYYAIDAVTQLKFGHDSFPDTLVLNNNGNVAIGKTTADSKLDVDGTVTATGLDINGDGYFSGNVNIGTTTTSDAKLRIRDVSPIFRISDSSSVVAENDVLGAIEFEANDNGILSSNVRLSAVSEDATGAASLVLGTGIREENAPERMRITSVGNVAIGKTIADSKLDIEGDIAAYNTATTAFQFEDANLKLGYTTQINNQSYAGIAFRTSTASKYGFSLFSARGTAGELSNLKMNFHDNSNTGTELIDIDYDGNITSVGNIESGGTVTATGYTASAVSPRFILNDTDTDADDSYLVQNENKFYINFNTPSMIGSKFVVHGTTGYVGINKSTDNPTSELDVAGTVTATAFNTEGIYPVLATDNNIDYNRAGASSYLNQRGLNGSIAVRLSSTATSSFDKQVATFKTTGVDVLGKITNIPTTVTTSVSSDVTINFTTHNEFVLTLTGATNIIPSYGEVGDEQYLTVTGNYGLTFSGNCNVLDSKTYNGTTGAYIKIRCSDTNTYNVRIYSL